MAVNGLSGEFNEQRLRFYAFQHPYICTFIEQLQKSGIPSLLTVSNQKWNRDNASHGDSTAPPITSKPKTIYFDFLYSPTEVVDKAYPRFNVDFDLSSAYGKYNWELFFHIPLFIATRLMQDQRHEEAMLWFHYIFDPTSYSLAPVPQRYWNFKPFRDIGVPERIQDLLWTLQDPNANEEKKEEVTADIDDWRDHPFQPHRTARGRPGAYMKSVVMKYLDNLIAWGDKLFRRDTIESINEATQLYILAANLLGARPPRVPPVVKVTNGPPTYKSLRKTLDAMSNGIVQIEGLVPFSFTAAGNGTQNEVNSIHGLANLAFCIPSNEKLLGYWNIIDDRLFKIRHCMNIEGVVRQLPLFEPPIDPALLVRATALGLDLSQVLDDLAAPLPHYRFTFMLQKARELCEELKQLGSLLLSVLEKKDAEKLAQIRAHHEKALLEAVREVKKKQIEDAENTHAGLQEARAQATLREQFYSSRTVTIDGERQQLEMLTLSTVLQTEGQVLQLAASFAHSWPDQFIGAITGTPSGAVWLSRITGGSPAGSALNAIGQALEMLAGIAQAQGSASGILAGYRRRVDEWKLQADIAAADGKQLDKQIEAAEIRRQIAENELANHEKQMEQAAEIEDFLREKFTNQDLYTFMVSQVSAVYFQAYKLAYDMAKRVERLYRHEIGISDSAFIQFGAWDNLRKGLLAGEKLSLDLRRLEHAYLEKNKREYEITKHVSLRQLNPLQLLTLRATGSCEIAVPEWLFDLDTPGHYMRRIKSVALSIPSVVGPYTSVNCTLSLLKSIVRKSAGLKDGKQYERASNAPDDRFVDYFGPVQSIVTSGANNESGLFETNLHDERLLPFEGAGAESRWRLELPPRDFSAFDYNTISDVILHIRYTARQGVEVSRVTESLKALVKDTEKTGLALLFSLRQDFPTEWSAFVNSTSDADFSATIRRDYLPYFTQAQKIVIKSLVIYDGRKVSHSRMVDEVNIQTATVDLNDNIKNAFAFTAKDDKTTTDPTKQVLLRNPDAQVFLIITYALEPFPNN
jgi:Tc toxin complex TcA C-terminal TcB-binding domain